MNDKTVTMALVDFIPVLLFFLGTLLLQKDLYNKMRIWQFGLLASGSSLVLIAGIYKATWKLLYAAGICDFRLMSETLFPMQTPGFILLMISMFLFVSSMRRREHRAMKYGKDAAGRNNQSVAIVAVAGVPKVYSGKLVFIIPQTLCSILFTISLCLLCTRMKKGFVCVFFILHLIGTLAMGGMSAKFEDTADMNWIAQTCNICSQGFFVLGVAILHFSGLGRFDSLARKV